MQAVILAAGRGSRMGDLTESTPKPLIEVLGKPLLAHKFDILPDDVDEVILIVGYLGSSIHDRFGGIYGNKRLLYVEQDVLDGTAGALWRAKDILKDTFLVMMGDDLYAKEDIEACTMTGDWSMGVKETGAMQGGAVEINDRGEIQGIQEGASGKGFVATGLFALDTRLFDFEMIPKSEGSSEYGLPQTVVAASKKSGIPFYAVEATNWIQVTSGDDIEKAERILSDKRE